MTRVKAIVAGLAMATFAALAGAMPAAAQRGDDRWELLGEERVGIGGDRDVIKLRQSEDYYRNKAYRRLRLVAEGGEVRMSRLRLFYMNGHVEDVQVNRDMRPGQQLDIDLGGDRAYLREIELNYASKFGFSIGPGGLKVNQATMKIFGENARGFAAPPPPVVDRPVADRNGGWFDIGRVDFDRRDDRAQIRVGRREGRIGQIALQVNGEPVTVVELRVRFANDERQTIVVSEELREGQRTRSFDLDGDRRVIDEVTVVLKPRNRPGRASLTLFGNERPKY